MKITAAVSRNGSPYPVLEDVEIEEPRPGEVLVRIVASGVCHTDLMIQEGGAPEPIVLGHEGAGVVEKVGAAVTELKPGDHVVLGFSFCGACPSCLDNVPSYCYEIMPRNFAGTRMDGSTPLSQRGKRVLGRFFGQSSFATHSLADASSAVKVAKDLPLDMLGPLGCGVMTGAGGVINALKLRAGQSIAVFGVGGVGLSAVMAAKLIGASQIVAVDVVSSRLDLARELGATAIIDARTQDPVEAIKELTTYGVDFSLNTTTLGKVFAQSLECLAMRGVAGFVAGPEPEWKLDFMSVMSGGRTLKAIIEGESSPHLLIPMLLNFYRQGRFPLDRLIAYYPFEKIADAFKDSASGKAIKPVLRMAK